MTYLEKIAMWRAAGICPCGNERAKPGAVYGLACREKRAEQDEERRAAGKCVRCGRSRGKCGSKNHCRRCLNRAKPPKRTNVRAYRCSNCGRTGHQCRVCPYPEKGSLP